MFEKGSPQSLDVPTIVNVDKKFEGYPIKFDLKTGCKHKSDTECNWGVVNYRCDLKNPLTPNETSKDIKFNQLLEKIKTCSVANSTCEQKFIDAFQEYISILNSDISHPEALTSESFRAIGNILLFISENKDVLGKLAPPTLESFLQLTDAVAILESDTFKKLSDFPDYSQN